MFSKTSNWNFWELLAPLTIILVFWFCVLLIISSIIPMPNHRYLPPQFTEAPTWNTVGSSLNGKIRDKLDSNHERYDRCIMAHNNCVASTFEQNETQYHNRSHRTYALLVQRPWWTLREYRQFLPKATLFAKSARPDNQKHSSSNCSFGKWICRFAQWSMQGINLGKYHKFFPHQ